MLSRHTQRMLIAAAAGMFGLAGAAHAQVQSATPATTPGPSVAGPATPATTPNPSVSTPATPAATPNASIATPAPSSSAPTRAPVTTMASPGIASSPIQMPSVIPGKSETAASAFDKLATSGATHVTKEEAGKLDGFDRAFSEADRDRDAVLNKDEFAVAWAIYTGRT